MKLDDFVRNLRQIDDGHDLDQFVRPEVRRAMWIAVGVCALLVLVGLVVLWPGGGDGGANDPLGLDGDPVKASVESVEEVPCSFDPLLACKRVEVVVSEGGSQGDRVVLEQPLDSTIEAGDGILVDLIDLGNGAEQAVFYDFQRGTPMLLLVIFRPNLENRVALLVLDADWFPRRRPPIGQAA